MIGYVTYHKTLKAALAAAKEQGILKLKGWDLAVYPDQKPRKLATVSTHACMHSVSRITHATLCRALCNTPATYK